jgi:hypothetical protein
MIDSTSQPAVSSTTPAERITSPMLRRARSRSMRILAMTGMAEMAMAVARKKLKRTRRSGWARYWSGISEPSTKPLTKGITMPIAEAMRAARPRLRSRRRSVSSPVSSRRRTIPSSPTTSSRLNWAETRGNTAAASWGAKCPSTVGPRTIPAASSPMTAGSAIRRHSSAPTRATNSSRASWMSSRKTECAPSGRSASVIEGGG